MSSGVESKGEVEVETPPKPLIRLLLILRLAGEFERTIILPLVIALSAEKKTRYIA